MPDHLKQLVNQRDREHAQRSRIEPERLIMAPRTTFAKRICLACRRVPDSEAYRAWWLAQHLLPKRFCRAGKWCRGQFKDAADHRDWHEGVYVTSAMPSVKGLAECPFCGGRLIEIS